MSVKERSRVLSTVYNALENTIGPSGWWPAETAFEVCIGAILTQNAPWAGVVKSIANLKAHGLFEVTALEAMKEDRLAALIRPSIYYNQKAKRLKLFCRFLLDRYDGDIQNMGSLMLDSARQELLSLSGIGYETADSILLYALKKPVFVVDAYTRRIFSRHSLLLPDCTYEEMRNFFEDVFEPDADFYGEFHGLICMLGAQICKRKPQCESCPLYSVLGSPVL